MHRAKNIPYIYVHKPIRVRLFRVKIAQNQKHIIPIADWGKLAHKNVYGYFKVADNVCTQLKRF